MMFGYFRLSQAKPRDGDYARKFKVSRLRSTRTGFLFLVLATAAPASAKDSLGTFESWGAFRDPEVPRCYAIAESEEITGTAEQKSYASIGFWPERRIRGQFHVRLSRDRSSNARVIVSMGGRRFRLTANRRDAWAQDKRMDAAIVAALRSATSMTVESVGRNGRPIVDAYALRGAATAIDAALLGCSRLK